MVKGEKFGSIDGGMGGMATPPPQSNKKSLNSPDYTYRSKPDKNAKVKPVHNPELFNKVLLESEKTKKRSSLLIDPDLVGRLVIVFIIFIVYMIFFR